MPKLKTTPKQQLYERGVNRVIEFCKANNLLVPSITAQPSEDWCVSACAYYREDMIKICLEQCANPCTDEISRNWNWPGSTVDREPYGVLCHELGHHADLKTSGVRGRYFGDYSEKVMQQSGEAPLTSYCPNPAEWFAEMFRLFVTNHALLKLVRPITWETLMARWKPISKPNWIEELGPNVPPRIIASNKKKAAR